MIEKLQDALKQGGDLFSVADIVEGVHAGRLQGWSSDTGFGVTAVNDYPQARAIHVLAACGELDGVTGLWPRVENFARENGCRIATMVGRDGWRKVLPAFGWQVSGTMFTRPVGGN